MKKAEIIFGAASILFASLFFVLAGSFPGARAPDVGMAFYPRILVVLIILLSASIILQAIRKRPVAESVENDVVPFFDTVDGGLKRVLIMIGMTIIYQQLLTVGGFLVITPIYLIILMLVFHASSWWKIVLISLATTLFIYIAFQVLLKIPLPTGIFYN